MSHPRSMQEFPLLETGWDNIVLFHPHIPSKARQAVDEVISGRWIGQGPRVEAFENQFGKTFAPGKVPVAVGSGTDALHLAYLLAGVKPGDEVITPVFTCTATNLPLLYIGAKPVFADIESRTLNINPDHVRALITPRTRAIACVPYGGLPCEMAQLSEIAREHGLALIQDAAHALGATYRGEAIGELAEFSIYSFQAVKHLTTGDGGMLLISDPSLAEKARRLRWFGIDRGAKQQGIWENDITEVGYKYQMTDLAAALGLAALEEIETTLEKRRGFLAEYERGLAGIPGLEVIGAGFGDRRHAAWLCTVLVERRFDLMRKLREHHIESSQVHYRNDAYTVFGGVRQDLPNMNALEDKYLVLPLHTKMTANDVRRVCAVIRSGW